MARRLVLLDACQPITFGSAGRFDLILDLERHAVAIGARASREVVRDPASSRVRTAIEAGVLPVESVDLRDPRELSALRRYDSMPAFQGRGEAEVLAIAHVRECLVGSDDAAVLRAALASSGTPGVVTSLDLIVWAVRERRITLGKAEELIDRIDIGPRIRKQLERARRDLTDLV